VSDFDSPWKEALALFFPEFLAYFFPVAHDAVDWTRPFETLDKELRQVIRDAESGPRIVDHLVKVWLLTGREEWVLVHIEIQTQAEADFSHRLYAYNYRLFDRYQRNVVSLAVLADERVNWRPDHYEFALWGFRVRMEFPIAKLLDLATAPNDLETNPNPFAPLTLAHMRTMETKNDLEKRCGWKFRLVKSLYTRGLSADRVRKLFRCIDWMMDLPKELENSFWQDVDRFEKENQMPFIDIATRKGMEQGEEIGKAIGIQHGIIESILLDWEIRFGEVDSTYREELQSLPDVDLLRKILRAGKTANSMEELRKLWKTDSK
jgi:hypothetical protein